MPSDTRPTLMATQRGARQVMGPLVTMRSIRGAGLQRAHQGAGGGASTVWKRGRMLRVLAAALVWTASWSLGPQAHGEEPARGLSPSASGAEIIDIQAALVWRRCVEGLQWSAGRCKGEPVSLTRREALDWARHQTAGDAPRWRVPRAPELQRLARLRAQRRALDSTLFPMAPASVWWSASVDVNSGPVNQYNYGNILRGVNAANATDLSFLHGLAVDMSSGELRKVYKDERLPLMLVRDR